jgi:hypothetical protein
MLERGSSGQFVAEQIKQLEGSRHFVTGSAAQIAAAVFAWMMMRHDKSPFISDVVLTIGLANRQSSRRRFCFRPLASAET